MDKMSLFSILTVSVPEAILNIYVGFLLLGEKTHLYWDDKINIIRLFIAVPLMVASAIVARAFIPSLPLIVLANIITYTLVIKYAYKFKLYRAFLITISFSGFLITVESLYVFQFVAFMQESVSTYYSSDITRLISSIPERALQIFAIISLWNWSKAKSSLREYKETNLVFFIFVILLFITEATFSVIFVHNFKNMDFFIKVIYSIGCFSFAFINFFLFKFITALSNAILKKEVIEMITYKNKVKDNIILINKSLESGDVETASKICTQFFK